MIYQHWIGTLTLDSTHSETTPRPVDLWLPAPAPVRASRFERDPWPAFPLPALAAPAGASFAGTVEYWYGDEDEEEFDD